MQRDAKGRFVSEVRDINNIMRTNTLKNKENKTMTNNIKKTNKELRMEVLNEAGVDTNKFFNLNLSNIPVGSPIQITVNGVTYDLTASEINEDNNAIANDPIAKSIIDNGYVFNRSTDGRFVTAQTFKMLNEESRNCKTREIEYGWDAYLRNNYSYMYQFDMMKDELKRLARMEKDNDPEFERLSQFFTKEVVVETCNQYIRQLKKYINKQKIRKCKGEPYVRLNTIGNVFVKDLDHKIFNPLNVQIILLDRAFNYSNLLRELNIFTSKMIKLPYETPKCSAWKDAFKGKGAYVTLLNIIKFHDVKIHTEIGILSTTQSVTYVENLLKEYKGEYWRFHELLKKTIGDNNFDLRKSIDSQRD